MQERFPPVSGRWYAADGTPESEMEMLSAYPELEGLEPYYIQWEFIWPM
ncbi:MAG TPA: hypothetical protein VK335_01755 [Bryobacteraceae bacterium]|nr:hypothetical protein [Bryobacteraceae bacterium]